MREPRPRVSVVLQSEKTECALATIVMIARYFGHEIDLVTLRKRYAHLHQGPTLRSILAITDALGLVARPLRLSVVETRRLVVPAILHWEFNHFVVVTRIRRRDFVIHDPAVGRRVVTPAEFSQSFTGVAVEFARGDRFVRLAGEHKPSLRTLLRGIDGLGRHLALMLGLLLGAQLLALVPPVATQLLVDEVVLGQDKRWLYRVVAGVALVMVTIIIVETLRRRVALYTGMRLAADSTTMIVQHMLRLPVDAVERRSVGDLMSRIDSLRPIRSALTETCLNVIVQITILITTLLVMFVYSAPLAMISLIAIVLIVVVQAAVLPRARALNLESVVASAQTSNSLIESLRLFSTVRALGLGPQRLSQWRKGFLTSINAQAGQARLGIAALAGQSLIHVGEHSLFLGIGIGGVVSKHLTLGILFAFLSLRGRLSAATAELARAVREIYLLRSHVDRVEELLREEIEVPSPDSALRQRLAGSIDCRRLVFRYPGGTLVLDNFNCAIGAGESVVICGPSGAGKSTLLRLLSGGLRPDRGSLRFDNVEAALWDVDALREQFGVVLQLDRLFQGTIADNVSCFDLTPDVGRIRDAASLAAIWEDLQALPMNIQMPIGDGGAGLSGGQVQRILLARALYRQPRILFLDEATSHLDKDTETRVLDNLRALGITMVSVAHGENALALGGRQIQIRRLVV